MPGIAGLEISIAPRPARPAAARGRSLPRLPLRPRRDARAGRADAAHRPRPARDRDRRAVGVKRSEGYPGAVRVLLISTYELGHQPLHLASPAAALEAAGHRVRCIDLSVERLIETRSTGPRPSASPFRCTPRCDWRLAPASKFERSGRGCRSVSTVSTPRSVDDPTVGGLVDRLIAGEYESELVEWVERARRLAGAATGEPARSTWGATSFTPRPRAAAAPRALRAVGARWRGAARGVRRGQPRLRAQVPALPGARRLRRPDPDRRADSVVMADIAQPRRGGAPAISPSATPTSSTASSHSLHVVRASFTAASPSSPSTARPRSSTSSSIARSGPSSRVRAASS